MIKNKKVTMILAMLLAAIIFIGSITAAAIAVGKKGNSLKKAENSDDNLNTTQVDINENDEYIPAGNIADTTPEITDFYYELYEGVPEEICIFAAKNDIPIESWPQELIEMLEKYPETLEFVLNYPYFKDQSFKIDNSYVDYQSSVPLFMQWDKRWGYTPYGDDMIGNAGCGPTCLSMVATYLLQDPTLDPKTMAYFSTVNGFCSPGDGSYWSLIYTGGAMLGLDVYEISSDEQSIIDSLKANSPIICLVGPGDFTYGGHFIVIADYVDGKFKINDPNSLINSEKLWEYDEFAEQIEVLWSCSV